MLQFIEIGFVGIQRDWRGLESGFEEIAREFREL
jgi:hypothetical protein